MSWAEQPSLARDRQNLRVLAHATASSCHAPTRGAAVYQRHLPETTLHYRTLQEHWLDFVRVRCQDCGHARAVVFSCKRRGFCPSCVGRRMADTAVCCVDHLSPHELIEKLIRLVPDRRRT